jgi:predicted P-loop ATPase
MFDDTTYQPTRLMYYPSTSKDGEFLTNLIDGPIMVADDILAELDDWTDVTTWPASSRETEVRRSASNQVEDPEAKGGIVGAFCRAFTLDEAIAEFLPDIYAPCEELGDDRYSFIAGSTSGGLIVYDHKLAYSHHNTDPAGGKLCNAFDLVRLHKFGDLDERVKEDTEVTKTPSYKAMADFAGALKEVKKEIVRERRESTANDYDTLETKARDTATNDDWVGELETEGKSGKIKSTINNVVLILNNDANLAGCFGFNEFEQRETAVKALPWDKVGTKYPRPLCDSDDAELRLYFERCYDITGKEKLADGLTVVIKANSYHPIRSYLDALEWDGVERLDTLFIRLFGADDTDYTRAITRKSFAAAVARIYQPGIKYDYIVVIIGDQGVGKSSTLKAMGGDWFSDSVTTLTGKEALESIQGAWLIELGELAGLRRAEVDAVKHFVSKTEDRYRVAYGKRIEHFPRRCVFFGTTNEEDFLRDVTGNRRFWVMNCKGRVGVTPFYDYMSKTTVAQLWAEAKERYARGEKLYLEDDLEGVARAIQDKHLEKDERSGLIREYLERKLPKNWDTLEPYSRRQWLKEEDNVGTVERGSVCILEIWTECLGKAPEDITRRDSMDIGRVMKTFRDWTPAPAARVKWYGAQKMYTKRA